MAHATSIGDSRSSRQSRASSATRRNAWRLAAAVMIVSLTPWPAHAQFGMLKKLKNAVSAPDSSARAKDSLAQIAAGVAPDSVKIGKGLLARGMSAAGEVSDKMEKTTGISAKDAALAATGVGAGGLLAKKMGVDPMSLGKQAIANAKLKAEQRAMQSGAGSTVMSGMSAAQGMTGLMGMPSAAQLQQMKSAIAAAGAKRGKTGGVANSAAMMGVPGYTQADAEAIVAFQQEMMQVAMAASAGDETAKARLDAWQTLTLKHQAEIEKLSLAAGAGDVSAVQKLQVMQFTIMKEWSHTSGTKARVLKAVKP